VVEGNVNRLKMIKRQMYGRACFPLLRKRVLLTRLKGPVTVTKYGPDPDPVFSFRRQLDPGSAGTSSSGQPCLDLPLLADAAQILKRARAAGREMSQRALAAELRDRGYHFSNSMLRTIAIRTAAREDGSKGA
jgi:hypothetical protein